MAYASVHVYWSVSVFVYFAVGAAFCSIILSVEADSEAYHTAVIVYTLVGLLLVSAWASYYANCKGSRSPFTPTTITVRPEEDSEYAVVHCLYVYTSLTVLVVTFIFWIWFLIYLLGIKNQQLRSVLEVYCVVLLPMTFILVLYFAASWWIPEKSRTVCSVQHIRFSTSSSLCATEERLHW